MEIDEILYRIQIAVKILLKNEFYNLANNTSERNLSAKLSCYLAGLFPEYDVDAEYDKNLYVQKQLEIHKAEMQQYRDPDKIHDDDLYSIIPDVIIHTRSTNNNLVVIEVKKNGNSAKSKEFDELKLKLLTSNEGINHYHYKLGIALILGTGTDTGCCEIKCFRNGEEDDNLHFEKVKESDSFENVIKTISINN